MKAIFISSRFSCEGETFNLETVEVPVDSTVKFKAIEVKKGLYVGDVAVVLSIAKSVFKQMGEKPHLKVDIHTNVPSTPR